MRPMQFQRTVTLRAMDAAPAGKPSSPQRPVLASDSPDVEASLPSTEDLRAIVVRVRSHDDEAKQHLYQIFNRGIRFQLVRHLGTTDLEDKVHDTFLIVLQAIIRNDLRDPERLLGYIRTVVRRQIATYIERASIARREQTESADADALEPCRSPEDLLLLNEKRRVMRETLSELAARDREILIRFYIDEVSQEEICEEMGLSINQFRLLKSRAKARFSELGRRQLKPKVIAKYRTVAS